MFYFVDKNLLIVGCGVVGSRHLQALAKIDIFSKILVVDPNQNSLENAKKLFDEVPKNEKITSIEYFKEFPNNIKNIDLCIVATLSNVRFKVLNEIVSKFKIKYLILEKFLFQTEDELEQAKKIIEKNEIKCWVNCFRREETCWKNIKKEFDNEKDLKLYYGNSEWGVTVNTIHILDLAVWLFNSNIEEINNSELNNKIYKSKRTGFIELTGKVIGKLKNNAEFELEANEGIPWEKAQFMITSENRKLIVNEYKKIGILSKKEKNWTEEEYDFHIPFQSEKTHKIVKKIIEFGTCNLPSLDESVEIHKFLLKSILEHINKVSKIKYTHCPIT